MIIHTVRPGETLFSIAASYGVDAGDLILCNDLPRDGSLAVGQNLLILIPQSTYTLPYDQTAEELSDEVGIPFRRILQLNPSLLYDPLLYAGRTLVLSYGGQPASSVRTVGYAYPFIGGDILSSALPYLSDLALFTYGFDANGGLIYPEADDGAAIAEAKNAGTAPYLLLSTLGPDGKFNSNLPAVLFENEEIRDALISRLLAVMNEKGYEGLDVDFEYIDPSKKEDYAAFITYLTGVMNSSGFPVTVALAPKSYADQPGLLYEAHDYGLLGGAANKVLLMTYEWGYTYGPPMPVAPLDKVARVLDYALTEIPADKILLGIPNYGYDWTLPYTPGTAARSLSSAEATALAVRYRAEILFDETAASPYFYYTDEDGRSHVVHFEDPRSFMAKLGLVEDRRLSGYGIWTVMRRCQPLFSETAVRFLIE